MIEARRRTGSRAEPANHADRPPLMAIASATASGAVIHPAPNRAAPLLDRLQHPLNRSDLRRRYQRLQGRRAGQYATRTSSPATTTARGRSRRPCRISSPISEASSMPMKAKHITPNDETRSPVDPATSGTASDVPDPAAAAPATTMTTTDAIGAERADVRKPFADRQPEHVHADGERQPPERHRRHEPLALDETGRASAARVGEHASEIHQLHREVKQVVRPVAPARRRSRASRRTRGAPTDRSRPRPETAAKS